jgi:hypothetical protein
MSKDKIFFEFSRMEPFKWPEPRDIRIQLESLMIAKYKNVPVSKITLSTEFVLKSLKLKNGSPEKPLLKYKVINIDWEDNRELKSIIFDKKMFRWTKGEETFNADNCDMGGY